MLGRIKLRLKPEKAEWLDRTALTELPDSLLVREAKGGNAEAYGELVHRYQDKLFTVIYGQIGAREDALGSSTLGRVHQGARGDRPLP